MADALIGADEIEAARRRIEGYILRTPLVALPDTDVVLKAEGLQPSGSFKVRGALNSILQLAPDVRARGVVAHSSGNHAQAVAWAGALLGVPVTVVMPGDAPGIKVDRTRRSGASVVIVGTDSSERVQVAARLAADEGRALIEPYDSDAVLAATATIAGEILADLPVDAAVEIYVPISGGGLAGGVASGAKLARADVRIVGVEPVLAATAAASRQAGERVALPAERVSSTIADGLRVRQVGERPWAHIEAHVDDLVTVSEDEIRDATRRIVIDTGLVAEPSGAVAAAAALRGSPPGPVTRVAVLSGSNVDPATLASLLLP